MGRVRITRPFVLLALAALLAPQIEASRTSVWESNPPASLTAAKTYGAGLLASLAPAAAADAEPTETPRFDLGDVVLVERELEREEHFDLGPLTLVDLNLLRGPPSSYPETRVRGFELLPPFRVGALPSLSLWGRQACGSISCGLVSDGPEDPWGLIAFGQDNPYRDEAGNADNLPFAPETVEQRLARCLSVGCASAPAAAGRPVVEYGLKTDTAIGIARAPINWLGGFSDAYDRSVYGPDSVVIPSTLPAGSDVQEKAEAATNAVALAVGVAKGIRSGPKVVRARPNAAPSAVAEGAEAPRQTFASGLEWYEHYVEQFGADRVDWTSGSGRTIDWPSELPRPNSSRLVRVQPPPRSPTFVAELEKAAGPRPPDAVAHHVDPLGLAGVDDGGVNGAWALRPSHKTGHAKVTPIINKTPYGTEFRIKPVQCH